MEGDGRGDDDVEHPDDVPRRRDDDDRLLPRLGSDLAYWWEISGWLKRMTALLGMAVALATCSFNVGMGAEYARGQWEGIPGRVNTLEAAFEVRRDSTILPLRRRVGRLDREIDTLRTRVDRLRGTLEKVGSGLEQAVELAEWNNCLLRVQSGDRRLSQCGPGGGDGP